GEVTGVRQGLGCRVLSVRRGLVHLTEVLVRRLVADGSGRVAVAIKRVMVRRREPLVTGCLHSDPVDVLDDLVEELGRDGSGAVMDRDVAESAAVVGVVGG